MEIIIPMEYEYSTSTVQYSTVLHTSKHPFERRKFPDVGHLPVVRTTCKQHPGDLLSADFTVLNKKFIECSWRLFHFCHFDERFREFNFPLGNSVFRHEKFSQNARKKMVKRSFFSGKKTPVSFHWFATQDFFKISKKLSKKRESGSPLRSTSSRL